jgi:hypothetical protein
MSCPKFSQGIFCNQSIGQAKFLNGINKAFRNPQKVAQTDRHGFLHVEYWGICCAFTMLIMKH